MRSGHPLDGLDIVCFATQAWHAHWGFPQNIAGRLAPHNRVVYIEPFEGMLSRLFPGSSPKVRAMRESPQLEEIRPNLFRYQPRGLYLPGTATFRLSEALNSPLLATELRRLFQRLNLRRPWFWAFFIQTLSDLDLGYERLLYDCADDWPSYFPNASARRFIAHVDETLSRRADLVFAATQPLIEKKRALNPRVFHAPVGADTRHYATAADPATEVPPELERIPHPRIGLIGMMDEPRIDAALLNAIAAVPGYQLVLVGGQLGKFAALVNDRPNIHRLGLQHVTRLPAFAKGMDVLIMPYRLVECTRYILPLKLNEYLATGKPTVAMAIPAVGTLSNYLYVARTHEEFLSHIRAALAESDETLGNARRELAARNDWDAAVLLREEIACRELLEGS